MLVALSSAPEELILQLGIGGGALVLLYKLLKPLLDMQLKLMLNFMESLKTLTQNNAGLLRTQADIGAIIQQFRAEMTDSHGKLLQELKNIKDKGLDCPMLPPP